MSFLVFTRLLVYVDLQNISRLSVRETLFMHIAFHCGRAGAQISPCLISVSNQLRLFPMGKSHSRTIQLPASTTNAENRKPAGVEVWDFLLTHTLCLVLPRTF